MDEEEDEDEEDDEEDDVLVVDLSDEEELGGGVDFNDEKNYAKPKNVLEHFELKDVAIMDEVIEVDPNENATKSQAIESFDISEINIESFLTGEHEEILFEDVQNDPTDFDLASYINENVSSNFLLSPPPPATVPRRITPLKKNQMVKPISFSTKSEEPQVQIVAAKPLPRLVLRESRIKRVTNTNRKRKFLSKAFIEVSSDDDSDVDIVDVEEVSDSKDNRSLKRLKQGENNPSWSPNRGVLSEQMKFNNGGSLGVSNLEMDATMDSSIVSKDVMKSKVNIY